MDYRKIIRNQSLRFTILRALSFVPDSIMLRLQYRIQLGRWPNFNHPKRYTEKMQLYKMKYRNPIMGKCVDKYEVRDYVKSHGLENILTKCFGVFERAEDIDFSILPEKFVIKTTDGGGGFNVLLCKDKNNLNITKTIVKVNSWLNFLNANPGREWAYTLIKKSRIIVEELLETDDPAGLIDYKFFCFNGQCDYVYVVSNRDLGEGGCFEFYDREFKKIPVLRLGSKNVTSSIKKPKYFDTMLQYAEILSKDFPHVRVDMYNIDGRIVFGELTFYHASGYQKFEPDSFDLDLGKKFDI